MRVRTGPGGASDLDPERAASAAATIPGLTHQPRSRQPTGFPIGGIRYSAAVDFSFISRAIIRTVGRRNGFEQSGQWERM
jgi:hypothetical protein